MNEPKPSNGLTVACEQFDPTDPSAWYARDAAGHVVGVNHTLAPDDVAGARAWAETLPTTGTAVYHHDLAARIREAAPGNDPSGSAVVTAVFPAAGPHDDGQTAEAAHSLAELARFLAYATGPHAAVGATQPGTLYTLIGDLQATFASLGQVLQQTCTLAADLAADPKAKLSDLAFGTDVWPNQGTPAATAEAAAPYLTAARHRLESARGQLAGAQVYIGRIGHDGGDWTTADEYADDTGDI